LTLNTKIRAAHLTAANYWFIFDNNIATSAEGGKQFFTLNTSPVLIREF